jgi:hypothetical protein
VESFGSSFCLLIFGRVSLAMEGKSVVPMEITFMDTEYKYGTLRLLRYIYSNQYRFPISFLGLPNFSFSEKLRGGVGEIYH